MLRKLSEAGIGCSSASRRQFSLSKIFDFTVTSKRFQFGFHSSPLRCSHLKAPLDALERHFFLEACLITFLAFGFSEA